MVSHVSTIFATTTILALAFVAPADEMPGTSSRPPHLRDPDDWARQRLLDAAGDDYVASTYGYSLIQYPRPLRTGDTVAPYGAETGIPPMECEHMCSLYFMDLRPGAHFAHPTVVGVYDWETGHLQTRRGQWWPVVNGVRPVFARLRERVWYSIDAQPGDFGLPTIHRRKRHRIRPEEVNISPPGISVSQGNLTSPACNVYALVINGFNDPYDSFDEDTDGMYTVLRGLGVPDDQIVFVSPIESDWRDYSLSRENIEAAIDDIATRIEDAGSCSEFVLFISSHGSKDELTLTRRKPHIFTLKGDDLDTWVSRIPACAQWTVLIEACHSASLHEGLSAAADKAQAERFRGLYSAGHDMESWGDLDDNDPNPDDLGSETIWGYIEAFGASSSAVSGQSSTSFSDTDLRVTFDEAIAYSELMDASKVEGKWFASVRNINPTATPAHTCRAATTDFDVGFKEDPVKTKRKKKFKSASGKAGDGTYIVKRCTNTPVWVTVTNLGDTTLPVGTLRLYGRTLDSDGNPASAFEPYSNLVLFASLDSNEKRTFKMRWGVRPLFKKKQRVELMAILDSPQAPVWSAHLENENPNQGAWTDNNQACSCDVEVVKRCFPIVGCHCRKYVSPEILLKQETN